MFDFIKNVSLPKFYLSIIRDFHFRQMYPKFEDCQELARNTARIYTSIGSNARQHFQRRSIVLECLEANPITHRLFAEVSKTTIEKLFYKRKPDIALKDCCCIRFIAVIMTQ